MSQLSFPSIMKDPDAPRLLIVRFINSTNAELCELEDEHIFSSPTPPPPEPEKRKRSFTLLPPAKRRNKNIDPDETGMIWYV
mmetsp:Transcript_13030/g.19771  ORF Transcript_13030/g.19771 Transcript_13030/m.19771 type:complete len:82 (-) Transcript_13030:161-406(-)